MSFLAKASRMLDVTKRSLGEKVTYRHKDGASVEIFGVWSNQFELLDADTQTMVVSSQTNIGVKLADLADQPKQDDEIDFQGVAYRVVDVQEDGQGAAQIFLYKII